MARPPRHRTPTVAFHSILDTVPTAPKNCPNNSRNAVQIKSERCPIWIGMLSKLNRNPVHFRPEYTSETDYCTFRNIRVNGAAEMVSCADPRVQQLMDSDKMNAYSCENPPNNETNSGVLPGTTSFEDFNQICNTYAGAASWTDYNMFRNVTINGSAELINCSDPRVCIENWSCSNWTACANNNQARSCADSNGSIR